MIHVVSVNWDNWGLIQENFEGINIPDFETYPGNRKRKFELKLVFRKFVALFTMQISMDWVESLDWRFQTCFEGASARGRIKQQILLIWRGRYTERTVNTYSTSQTVVNQCELLESSKQHLTSYYELMGKMKAQAFHQQYRAGLLKPEMNMTTLTIFKSNNVSE